MANGRNGTLYIGVTSNLPKRVQEHRDTLVEGFTKKYGLDRLVYYEESASAEGAVTRERQLKKWNRLWKLRIIEEMNPGWKDLSCYF